MMMNAADKRRLLLGAALATVMSMSTASIVTAQEAEDAAEEPDLIVVTGSRIARDPNIGSPVPIQSIDADDIRLSGNPDVAATLIETPALLTSTTFGNSIGGIFGSGSGETQTSEDGEAILNLRGLGIERTLVLVDGRRHVSGVGGASAVDVGSIPRGLIERVDVLTGGASAIYGADAVSGVVNFIMKDDYEGLEFDVQGGISDEGDGEQWSFSGLYGKNFDNDRGNFTLAIDYSERTELQEGDRDFSRDGRTASDFPNPDLRFQSGDIGSDTPNFAEFYSISNGFYPTGFGIPTAADFVADYTAAFGVEPTLTSAEQALIDRAANAPGRAILPFTNFSISSNSGVVVPADFDPASVAVGLVDVNGNGIPDCDESFLGYNSLFQGNAFGLAGGCWNSNLDGSPAIYQDGLILGNFNQAGGDGATQTTNLDTLTPFDRKIAINLAGDYDLTNTLNVFGEFKYVRQRSEVAAVQSSFWDLLTVESDNPFIPAELQPVADAVDAGGFAITEGAALYVTRDPIDLGADQPVENTRETFRFVGGVMGELPNGWQWEISGNYGRFDLTSTDPARVIPDRFFAAIDVTTDANGNPICESDIEQTTAPATTIFGIPGADPAILSFTPGDGSCQPINVFGIGTSSQAAVDFVTEEVTNEFSLEQLVISGYLTGNSEQFFELPAGPVDFAFGAEYRDEQSESVFDPLVRGVIPVDSIVVGDTVITGTQGTLLSEQGLTQNSLAFDPESLIQNATGSYDVYDVFGEISVPVLAPDSVFGDLRADAAFRFSDYSTVGETVTWKGGGEWAPITDVRFRGAYSVAVRAPNIEELFSPDQGAFFRPDDPCDQTAIDALIASGDPRGPIREANCRADGLPEGYLDPLSARFVGVTGGNADLQEETAKTFTVGAVIQPRWFEGLSLSADYWNIRIEDAIEEVSDDDIVSNCYDSANFPNQFCSLFTRNRDPNSPQFLGFNFLRQTQLNFGAIETDGIDFTAGYRFSLYENDFDVSFAGSRVMSLDEFFDPGDPSAVDPELGELQRPRWAWSADGQWTRGPLSLGWKTQYLGEQTFRDVEIETVEELYGGAPGIADAIFIHDLTATFAYDDRIQLYGGVNNVTDELPYLTEFAFPVDPVGRFFFFGANVKLQ